MKLHFQWRLFFSVFFLILLFFLIQGYFYFVLKNTFYLSSLTAFGMVILVSYFVTISLSRPISELTKKINQFISSHFEQKMIFKPREEVRTLLRTIDEVDTLLKKEIEEISKEKEYLQTILKGMSEGVMLVEERGRIVVANHALQELLSLPSDVTHRTPLEVIRNAELEEAIRKVIQSGKSVSFELNLPPPIGKTLEVNVVAIVPSPIEVGTKSEGIHGAIAVFHDISRLKELEKVRQDFVANVSHELRTPLTSIKGYVETLLEGALNEDIATQFVQIIKKHTDRLTKIVEDLLTLSKIESREFQLKFENISVLTLIEDVIDFVKESAEKKKISIIQNTPPSLSLRADRNYIEQVLINLCDNSIKYGREEGKITISVIENDQEIQFSIKDDGIGIPSEDLPRIFERFYRVDKGRSQELGGTGLGLSIVKHIVQAHGGRVWAESQLGEGSTFYFTLPCS